MSIAMIALLVLALLAALRGALHLAIPLVLVVAVLSYLASPAQPFALLQAAWQAAQRPLRDLAQALAPLGERAVQVITQAVPR